MAPIQGASWFDESDIKESTSALTLVVCWIFGLVPFVGLVLGVAYYRLTLVSALSTYIPRSENVLLRLGIRLLTLVMLAFQWLPVIGSAFLPLMCYINYTLYSSALRRQFSIAWAPAQPAPALA